MEELTIYRRNGDPVHVISELGWEFHHLGIPVKEEMPGERYIPHLKMYVAGFGSSPFGIEKMRFEEDCPLPEIVKEKPHPAFVVPNLDEALEEFNLEVLTKVNSPSDGVKVAMILHQDMPVELMEFSGK